ncbi:MAG: hypothetical protein ABSB22_03150 [Thermodesulfobacteriota bacterium]
MIVYYSQSGNTKKIARAIEKLNHMEKEGMKIITGHDPEVWKGLKKAPEYYE